MINYSKTGPDRDCPGIERGGSGWRVRDDERRDDRERDSGTRAGLPDD